MRAGGASPPRDHDQIALHVHHPSQRQETTKTARGSTTKVRQRTQDPMFQEDAQPERLPISRELPRCFFTLTRLLRCTRPLVPQTQSSSCHGTASLDPTTLPRAPQPPRGLMQQVRELPPYPAQKTPYRHCHRTRSEPHQYIPSTKHTAATRQRRKPSPIPRYYGRTRKDHSRDVGIRGVTPARDSRLPGLCEQLGRHRVLLN